ncbi:MAG: LysR family transcriptional regulator, partial [Methylophilales bacterium 16-45-9]
GVTVLPCSAATERYINPLVKVIPFDDPVPSRRVALAWRKSYARELAVTSVADAIRLIKSNCLQMIVKTQEKT